jgi:hypothetical protein
MNITRDRLLNFRPRTTEVVLPGDAGSVWVRELRASEVITFTKNQAKDGARAVYMLIAAATVENDQPVFTADDIAEIAAMPYAVSDAIVDAILTLSGLKDDAKKKQNPPSADAQKSDTTINSD